MDVLDACQSGQLVAAVGIASDLEEAQCRQALERLTRDIARRVSERVSEQDDIDDLLDVLDEEEEYEYLDNPKAMLGRDGIADGEEILKLLYGSLDEAGQVAAQIGAPRGVDDEVFARLMTVAASLTLAAMARRNKQFQMSLADHDAAENGSKGGFVAMLVSALVAGLMQALRQAVRPSRRRRKRNILTSIFGSEKKRRPSSTSRRKSRRRKSRRRKTPTLKDLLGDIIGG